MASRIAASRKLPWPGRSESCTHGTNSFGPAMTKTPFTLTPAQQAFYEQTFNNGYNQWAGLTLKHIEPGFAHIAFLPRPEMLTPWGTLNGGVLNSLVEVPAFLA